MSESSNPALANSLMDVPVRVDVVLGEARMPIEELMQMAPGDVVGLNWSSQTVSLASLCRKLSTSALRRNCRNGEIS